MKPRDGRDGRGAGAIVRTGGRRERGGAPDRRQQQYTPLAGDAELAEVIERDVLNRNPVCFAAYLICDGCLELVWN